MPVTVPRLLQQCLIPAALSVSVSRAWMAAGLGWSPSTATGVGTRPLRAVRGCLGLAAQRLSRDMSTPHSSDTVMKTLRRGMVPACCLSQACVFVAAFRRPWRPLLPPWSNTCGCLPPCHTHPCPGGVHEAWRPAHCQMRPPCLMSTRGGARDTFWRCRASLMPGRSLR